MKKSNLSAVLCAALVALWGGNAMAQDDAPKGKVVLTTFSNFGVGFDDQDGTDNTAGFELERAYLGYDYKLNDAWSAKVVYDMGKGDDGKLQRLGYVKNAYVTYSKGNLKLEAGLTGTEGFNAQEKMWGYRYVYKSFMDQNKWGSSADLGVKAKYKVANWMDADVSVFNGEGYKKVQLDNQFLYGLGVTLKPFSGFQLRLYADMKTAKDTAAQATVAISTGYKGEKFSVGAEYDLMRNQGNSDGHHLNGLSLYATGNLGEKMSLFGRYDWGSSSTDLSDNWSYGEDGQMLMLGLQCKVNKMVSVAPNFLMKKHNDVYNYFAMLSMNVSL
ncbi:MAG: porin [Bacteroidales bacterium]|nr:porin [Bacteroidales bacterium]